MPRNCICHEHKPECDCTPDPFNVEVERAYRCWPATERDCDCTPDPFNVEVERALLTGEQSRFLILHARRLVVRWQWLFGNGTLRAESEGGDVACITRAGLEQLYERGLMDRLGYGAKLTDQGRQVVAI